MQSLIGISIRGKTFLFFNTLSQQDLSALKELANIYRCTDALSNQLDDIIIKRFVHDANTLLNIFLYPIDLKKIIIIK